ncbi:MAG: exodeoxyribonuclease VII small subunit [Ignavibacteria bacterium]|nr:exodeoxyribonuclease VII small subunit [Ignavibacteria bacterium]
MTTKKQTKNTFEQAYKRLEEIMEDLEVNAENIPLEKMLSLYQESLKLLKICRDKLNEAELKIEKIKSESN